MILKKIKKIGYSYFKFLLPSTIKEWRNRNRFIFNDLKRPISENMVNLFWTGTYHGKITNHENLGDYLSLIIVDYLLEDYNLNLNNKTN